MLALALVSVLPAAARTLSWREALQAAQAAHPLVRGRQQALAAARADIEAAEWRRYPSPSVEAGALGGNGTRAVRLDQPIWAGGRIEAGIQAASRRGEASEAAVRETQRELVRRTLDSVSEAARQAERAAIAERNLQEHDRLLGLIQRRLAQEVSPAADEALARSRRAVAATEVSLARQAQRNALSALTELAGQQITQLDPAGYAQAGTGGPAAEPLPMVLDRVLAASALLRRLQAEIEVANAEIDERQGAALPQVVFRVEHLRGDLRDTRAGVLLNYQPGAGLSASAAVAAAVARREAAREALEAAQRQLVQQVTQEWNDGAAARERAESAALVRASAAEVAASYTRQYTVGRKSWLDVLNAVREASQAELALVDTQHQAWLSALRLRQLAGEFDLAEAAQPDRAAAVRTPRVVP